VLQSITFGLVGGLGLFLYGMKIMAAGMQKAAGDKLRRILELLTSNPYMATLTGVLVTVLVQSSSTTSVMVVGFTNSGLMGLSQALGTMLGANIGTTVTAQLVSFNISVIIYPAIGIGAGLNLFSNKRFYKSIGQGILGVGLLFLGLKVMSEAMYPLRSYEPFLTLLATFGRNPILGVVVGALFTAVVQSSSATSGVVIALTLQGVLDTPAAIAIVLGANIGTAITATLASIGTNLTARRAVLAIICVKVVGVVGALLVFRPFVLVAQLTGDTVARQVANAHTIFNVLNVALFLPFMKPFLAFIERIMPGEVAALDMGVMHLDKRIIGTPSLAIEAARQEVLRMASKTKELFFEAKEVFLESDRSLIDPAMQKEELIDHLEKEITIFLSAIAQKSLSEEQSQEVSGLMHICSDLERIGDHSQNIVELAQARMEDQLRFSELAFEEIKCFFKRVEDVLSESILAYERTSELMAKSVIEKEIEIDLLERQLRKNHIMRLNQGVCVPQAGIIYLELITNLERIADHATNLAEVVTGEF
jgi:phosphate:Na+ symporter